MLSLFFSYIRRQFSAATNSEDARRQLISAYDRLLDKLQCSNIPGDAHYRKSLTELFSERKNYLASAIPEADIDLEAEHERLKDEEKVLKLMEEEKPWESSINKSE